MAFVPMAPVPPPSPRAQELARRLKSAIEGFLAENPDMTAIEIRQAMDIARQGSGSRNRILAVVLLAFAVALGIVALYFYAQG